MISIPKTIFQTGPYDLSTRPHEMRFVEQTRTFCADHGFDYEFFDDNAMFEFVRKEFPEWNPTFEALESIIEKADLWRYLVVLRYGGFYLDLDCEILPTFAKILDRLDRPLIQIEDDRWLAFTDCFCQLPEFGQFFFAFPPNSPLLLEVVREVARRVKNRTYAHKSELQQVLHHTGPGVFGAVLTPYRATLRLFRPNSLVWHHCQSSWLKGRAWGKKSLLIRRCFMNYEQLN